MAEYMIQDTTLAGIANAIRSKTGGTGALTPEAMAAAIAGLGGLPGGFSAFTLGSFSSANQANDLTITHKLGVKPNFFFMIAEDASKPSYGTSPVILHSMHIPKGKNYMQLMYVYRTAVGSVGYSGAGNNAVSADDWTAETIHLSLNGATGKFSNECTYYWICGVMNALT